VQQELHEKSEIANADAIVYPGAVVVHPDTTLLATAAVVHSRSLVIFTFIAPRLVNHR